MQKTKVKTHKRVTKNKVSVVAKHYRGKYGPKPKNDRYPKRDGYSTPREIVQKNYEKYSKEYSKLLSGELVSSSRHKAFILRRLTNAKRILNKQNN